MAAKRHYTTQKQPTLNISKTNPFIYFNVSACRYLVPPMLVNLALDKKNQLLYVLPEEEGGEAKVEFVNRDKSGRIYKISLYKWLESHGIIKDKYHGKVLEDGSLFFEIDIDSVGINEEELVWFEDKDKEKHRPYKIEVQHDGIIFSTRATSALDLPCKVEISLEPGTDGENEYLVVTRYDSDRQDITLLEVHKYNNRSYVKHNFLKKFFNEFGIKREKYDCYWDEDNKHLKCILN